jgi:hypothetical protein
MSYAYVRRDGSYEAFTSFAVGQSSIQMIAGLRLTLLGVKERLLSMLSLGCPSTLRAVCVSLSDYDRLPAL